MANVAVLGLGAWGSALALHCARQGNHVTAWHRNASVIAEMRQRGTLLPASSGQHPGYAIPATLTLTEKLGDCCGAECVVVALPAKAWATVLPQVTGARIVSATKGLEPSTTETPLTYLAKNLQRDPATLCVLSGPSFASDLAAGRPLSLVAASASEETASFVAQLFSGSSSSGATASSPNTVRIYTATDTLGVELGGIVKNIVAIAAGVSDALQFGPSARAAIITRGLAEMTRFATALGAHPMTLAGLSGLGDLIMTATDDQSRNRQVGLRLGRGETIDQVVQSLGSVAEGVATAPILQSRAASLGLELPITDHVVKLIRGEITAEKLAKALLGRPRKREF